MQRLKTAAWRPALCAGLALAGILALYGKSGQSAPARQQGGAAAATRAPDVPYVPTPDLVVQEMLRLASVKAGDVVYDLGCGDGRIVIAAAKQYGARGVGIDINPERIKESNENTARAGVGDRVRFTAQDLFEADLSDATVVTLYLLPSVNLKLRPKLLRELKPGTRVVSHAFRMGDWKPEKSVKLKADGIERTIYLWTVPAR